MVDPQGVQVLVEGTVFYLVFVVAVTLHEGAHAWAAKRGGDPTAYHGGQVTIDPRPHMRREPFGMVWLPLASVLLIGWPIGYASAPYDPRWAHLHPRRAGWMSLAGPGANLALVGLAAALVHVGVALGAFAPPASAGFARVTMAPEGAVAGAAAFGVSVLFSMNLVLFLLNMIPLPPLDGSTALLLVLPERTVERYQAFLRQPALAWGGILVAWYLFGGIFHPVFLFALNLLYPGMHYG